MPELGTYSRDLFGIEGDPVSEKVQCGFCGRIHNGRRGEKGIVYVTYFGKVLVAECCFVRLESAVSDMMPQILLWYEKVLDSWQDTIRHDRRALSKVSKQVSFRRH